MRHGVCEKVIWLYKVNHRGSILGTFRIIIMLFIGKRHSVLKTMSEQRTTRTRSGRSVKEPTRYEPDPDAVFEDDFSDSDCEVDSDEEQYSGCESTVEYGLYD